MDSHLVYDIDDLIIRAKQMPIEWCKFEISEPLLVRATNWDNHRSIIGRLSYMNNNYWVTNQAGDYALLITLMHMYQML